jgi:hypothetical protein
MWLIDTKKLFITSRRSGASWKGIKTSLRPVLKKSFPRLPILDEKEIRMQFKENIIVRGELMNGD